MSRHRKLDEYSGKKMTYAMPLERVDDNKDVKHGLVINDKNGKLVADMK